MARGKVHMYDSEKGYGLIKPDREEECLFVHRTSILDDSDAGLKPDQVVHFSVHRGPHGRQAIDVRGC